MDNVYKKVAIHICAILPKGNANGLLLKDTWICKENIIWDIVIIESSFGMYKQLSAGLKNQFKLLQSK